MSRKCRVSTKTTKLFADRLSDLVDEKKGEMYSQKQIASSIGVSSGSLSEWCSDQVTATIDNLVQVARFFGVSSDYLLGLTDVRKSNVDVRNICERTGLNEEVVSLLFSNNKVVSNFINCLLTLPTDLLNSIAESYSYCAFLKAFIDNGKENSEVNLSISMKYPWGAWIYRQESVDDGLDFLQYKLGEKLNEAIHDSALLYKTGKITFTTGGGNGRS